MKNLHCTINKTNIVNLTGLNCVEPHVTTIIKLHICLSNCQLPPLQFPIFCIFNSTVYLPKVVFAIVLENIPLIDEFGKLVAAILIICFISQNTISNDIK